MWARISGAERILANAAGAYIQPSTVGARRVWENEECLSSNERMLRTYLGRRPRSVFAGLPYVWDRSGLLHDEEFDVKG